MIPLRHAPTRARWCAVCSPASPQPLIDWESAVYDLLRVDLGRLALLLIRCSPAQLVPASCRATSGSGRRRTVMAEAKSWSAGVESPVKSALRCVSVPLIAGLTVGYLAVLRPYMLRWGATDDEVNSPYLTAELIPGGTRSATMAVTIDAPRSEVWPWLVQMGADRGGWYSWDHLDNFGHHSADPIHPEWQAISLGDSFAGEPSGRVGWEVAVLEPERFLGLRMSLDLQGRPFDPALPRRGTTPTPLGDSSCRVCPATAPGWWSAVIGRCGRSGYSPSPVWCCWSRRTGSCRTGNSQT